MLNLMLVLFLLLGLSCGVGESAPTVPGDADRESRESRILNASIGPELVDCVGVAPRKCLVVDGYFFYDSIEGFDHEPGYRYVIKMEQYDAWPDQDEPPQDASRFGYRLIEILEKVREP